MESKALPPTIDSRMCGLMDAAAGGWYQRDTNELYTGFPISAADTVLDFGCGGGGAALFCGKAGADIYFADTDEAKLAAVDKQLRTTAARGIHKVLMTSSSLDLNENSMSRVIAMEVLEHTPNPREILDELVRVAKPGALFLLTVPDARGEELQRHIAPANYFTEPNHIQVFNREAFTELVEGAGLTVEKYFNQGFYWLLWMCFNWLSQQEEGRELNMIAQDTIEPPYNELGRLWSTTWHRVLKTQGGHKLKNLLDNLMPLTQGIIARKP